MQNSASAVNSAIEVSLFRCVQGRTRGRGIFQAVPDAGLTIPCVFGVIFVSRSCDGVADACALFTAPVFSSAASGAIRLALASAIIIIKIIICSARLFNTYAVAINVIPNVGLSAFSWQEAADAIVTVGHCIVSLWSGNSNES